MNGRLGVDIQGHRYSMLIWGMQKDMNLGCWILEHRPGSSGWQKELLLLREGF